MAARAPCEGAGKSTRDLIQTNFGNVAFTTHPIPNLDVRASDTVDDRSNFTPRSAYAQYTADAFSASPRLAFNLPESYRDQKCNLELGYRIAPGTRV